jgi:hypothetical protein
VGDFEAVLGWLRALEHPCAPPMGVGEFDVRYVSEREIVVWYSPARDGHRAGEVAIATEAVRAAWQALAQGSTLDEGALSEIGSGASVGRWLLALLALLPEVRAEGMPPRLALARPEPIALPTRKRRRARPPAASA